jgi:very-short-patch-repair endonuclease
MIVKKNNQMLDRARELRREMTPQERKLWYLFLRQYPVKIYKQRIIESFIVDFYCASAKLVIELDGSQHYTEQGVSYDTERSQVLSSYGLEVLRFSNLDVDTRFRDVCDMIDVKIRERLSLPSQSPTATAPRRQAALPPVSPAPCQRGSQVHQLPLGNALPNLPPPLGEVAEGRRGLASPYGVARHAVRLRWRHHRR